MQRTLVFIPHEVAGLPVLGLGWALILLGIALVVRLMIARSHGPSVISVLSSEGPMWAVVAVVIALVLPRVELHNAFGEPVGMAIRGYGVLLLTAFISAAGLAMYRAKRRGLDPDVVISIAPWAFVGGILGARVFYVVQYRDQFISDSLTETLGNMLDFTGGGLVVYGSFIGGFIAVAFFVSRRRLSFLQWGDVIVPCLFLGLFFGRIGCLMNGCCYGGRCEDQWWALHFPAGSPVYGDQIATGELLGLQIDRTTGEVEEVYPGSLAESAGIERGSSVEQIFPVAPIEPAPRDVPEEDIKSGVIATVDGQRYRWSPDELPERALPVQPAQLISSFSALALCLALCAVSPLVRREGTVMMLGFAGYAVLRFVLELVRVDEGGQFGTRLSISQFVSLAVLTLSIAGLIWIYQRPKGGSLQPQRAAET